MTAGISGHLLLRLYRKGDRKSLLEKKRKAQRPTPTTVISVCGKSEIQSEGRSIPFLMVDRSDNWFEEVNNSFSKPGRQKSF